MGFLSRFTSAFRSEGAFAVTAEPLAAGALLSVVGESHYKPALDRTAAMAVPGSPPFPVGVWVANSVAKREPDLPWFQAVLVREPDNPYDSNAIAVYSPAGKIEGAFVTNTGPCPYLRGVIPSAEISLPVGQQRGRFGELRNRKPGRAERRGSRPGRDSAPCREPCPRRARARRVDTTSTRSPTTGRSTARSRSNVPVRNANVLSSVLSWAPRNGDLQADSIPARRTNAQAAMRDACR